MVPLVGAVELVVEMNVTGEVVLTDGTVVVVVTSTHAMIPIVTYKEAIKEYQSNQHNTTHSTPQTIHYHRKSRNY